MKGVTIACTNCREILFRYLNAKGEVSFDMMCPNCQTLVAVSVKLEPKIIISKIVPAALVILFFLGAAYFYIENKSLKSQVMALSPENNLLEK